jgi:taurine dioxygenase
MTALTRIAVRPLTSVVGAEISGIDLREPLDDVVVAELRQALLDHGVLFFREQAISKDDHLRFCRSFGEVMVSSSARLTDEAPGINILDQVNPKNQATDRWHSDHMYMPEPAMATVLRSVESPAVGGDTCYLSMLAAYDDLSDGMKHLLEDMTAVNTAAMAAATVASLNIYKGDIQQSLPAPSVHPVIRVHPESGRRALFVSPSYTTRILELSQPESDAVLRLLFEHMQKPDYQCRFRWEANSIAFWDNRSVQHYAVPDYYERRVMNRAMIAGDRPVGPAASR